MEIYILEVQEKQRETVRRKDTQTEEETETLLPTKKADKKREE